MTSPGSWWWPRRPVQVPRARAAWLLVGLGIVGFATCTLVLRAGATSWDTRLYQALNAVPPGLAAVLTPLTKVFLPAGLAIVAVVATGYVLIRNRAALPVAVAAAAAGAAWLLANLTKLVAERPRPYEVVAGAVLRQQPAHGTSFPSSHTAVTLAIVLALVPFVARPVAVAAIAFAVAVGWSRVYLGVHYPLDVLAGAAIGLAVGGLAWLTAGWLLRGRGGNPARDGGP